jgi:2-keto-4-pentenoate hydratase/2-oxohepta-3-ene-1,7-dioic acid hydratase in catechol pathway
MRIVRFRIGDKIRYGALEETHVVEYSGTPFSAFRRGRQRYPARQVVLLAPALPSKIIVVGPTYREHAAELGVPVPSEPLIALKPVSALIGPDDPIVHPIQSGHLECEAELAIVMRRRCRNAPRGRALEHVLGYTCLNDITARDLEEKDRMPGRAKAFDTFCPIGPCIATDIDPNAVTIETWINGACRHSMSTAEMIFPVDDLVARVSEIMTLMPGDIIATGTPAGVGPLAPGDRVEVRIAGIGALANTVVKV